MSIFTYSQKNLFPVTFFPTVQTFLITGQISKQPPDSLLILSVKVVVVAFVHSVNSRQHTFTIDDFIVESTAHCKF